MSLVRSETQLALLLKLSLAELQHCPNQHFPVDSGHRKHSHVLTPVCHHRMK